MEHLGIRGYTPSRSLESFRRDATGHPRMDIWLFLFCIMSHKERAHTCCLIWPGFSLSDLSPRLSQHFPKYVCCQCIKTSLTSSPFWEYLYLYVCIYIWDTIHMCKNIETKPRHLHFLGETIETCTENHLFWRFVEGFTVASPHSQVPGCLLGRTAKEDLKKSRLWCCAWSSGEISQFHIACLIKKGADPSFSFHTYTMIFIPSGKLT